MQADDRETAVSDPARELEHARAASSEVDRDPGLPVTVSEAVPTFLPVRTELGESAFELGQPRRASTDGADRARAEPESESCAPAGELLEGHEGTRCHRELARDRVRHRGPKANAPGAHGGGAEEGVELAPEHRRIAHPDSGETSLLGQLGAVEQPGRRLRSVDDEIDCAPVKHEGARRSRAARASEVRRAAAGPATGRVGRAR